MFKEYRPADCPGSASTPDVWASTFADSGRLGTYHRLIFGLDHRFRLIRRAVKPGARILDAGCGAGEWVAFLNERGYDAEGLDYSPRLIANARRLYPACRWTLGSLQTLPYEDLTFDAVISWGAIEHDEDGPGTALREFHRVVKPGGTIIVTVPIDTIRQRRASQSHFPATGSTERRAFFQYFMTLPELTSFVREAGFDIVDSGAQHSTALTLMAPELSARLTVPWRNRLNKLVRLAFWWHRGAMNMAYCVGRKV